MPQKQYKNVSKLKIFVSIHFSRKCQGGKQKFCCTVQTKITERLHEDDTEFQHIRGIPRIYVIYVGLSYVISNIKVNFNKSRNKHFKTIECVGSELNVYEKFTLYYESIYCTGPLGQRFDVLVLYLWDSSNSSVQPVFIQKIIGWKFLL